ncbi:MAG: sugar phosphate isomerase/epimerase family protein [Anaerolineae bacterium]
MRKAISIWAFTADKSLEECLRLAKDAGFDAVELAYATDGFIHPGMTDKELADIRALADSYGLALPSLASGIFWGINPISDKAEERAEAKVHAREMLRIAHVLGAAAILFVPGSIGPFMAGDPVVADYEAAYNRAIADVKELAVDAEHYKVYLGVENVWNRFLVSPLEMRAFVDAIGSPYVGVYFDVGNVLRTGYPQQWIKILGQRIKAVHFKDFKCNVGAIEGFVELLEGDVDYPAVMAAFAEAGYDGWAVVEQFPTRQYPDAMIYRASTAVDVIFGGKAK